MGFPFPFRLVTLLLAARPAGFRGPRSDFFWACGKPYIIVYGYFRHLIVARKKSSSEAHHKPPRRKKMDKTLVAVKSLKNGLESTPKAPLFRRQLEIRAGLIRPARM